MQCYTGSMCPERKLGSAYAEKIDLKALLKKLAQVKAVQLGVPDWEILIRVRSLRSYISQRTDLQCVFSILRNEVSYIRKQQLLSSCSICGTNIYI